MAQSQTSIRITVSLPGDDHAALSVIAERCNASLCWLARRAVAEFLENHGRGGTQLALEPSFDNRRREA